MVIAITMGDAAGVGPEIALRSFLDGEIPDGAVVYGDLSVLQYCAETLGLSVPLRAVRDPREAAAGQLNVLDFARLNRGDFAIGKVSAASGAAARHYVVEATKAALARRVEAVVTLPMNKEATRLSDPQFIGHTELIASLCGVERFAMMLALDELATTFVSTHVSLAEAIRLVRRDRVIELALLMHETLSRFIAKPRLAVAGLNPHAGEAGIFGDEENREIAPAVREARDRGLDIEGPLPPDTVFLQALRRKRFDAIICMYHDQGHIPLKLYDFEGGVNVTLGLPMIRTSVDHGTAFDIAYQGKASTRSLVAALRYARKLMQTDH